MGIPCIGAKCFWQGAKKTAVAWEASFRNWKNEIRLKARQIKSHAKGIGGGAASDKWLTELEERALLQQAIYKVTSVFRNLQHPVHLHHPKKVILTIFIMIQTIKYHNLQILLFLKLATMITLQQSHRHR